MPDSEDLITSEECCSYYNIELSFLQSLNEYGLIEMRSVEEKQYLPNTQLSELEKFIRLHYELGINMEGIDAIAHLLLKMKAMQEEVAELRNLLQIGGHFDREVK
ncbi:MAG: chaperone modulator CbpM [Chitinophagaceae bacterium]|nr:chaperone modulator CbpM [Chitinophagaceae bacterium]